jgi:hypothetical protein
MKQHELSVLSNVIAVARRELADRDEKEIPSRIRRVAKRGGSRLPPPFQVSLVKELRANDAFRESVLERWESEGMEDAIGYAFLSDPEGSFGEVSAQAASENVESLEAELDRATETIRSLEGQIAESKARLTNVTKRHGVEVAGRDAAAATSRVSLEKAVRSLTARIAEMETDQRAHSATVDELRSEIDDLTEKRKRSITRTRKRAQRDQVKVRQPISPPSDPLEFAGWLDTVEKQQRSFRQARRADAEVVPEHPPLCIPAGLLPDSHEALSALIDQGPDAIYVDGYNVGAMLVEDFGTSTARARVVAIADRLAFASQARVVVVFDAVGVEGRESAPSPGPAEVRFTHAQIADDEIVDLMRGGTSRAAVITSDRELINRCATEGCVTVWSEALVQWAGR